MKLLRKTSACVRHSRCAFLRPAFFNAPTSTPDLWTLRTKELHSWTNCFLPGVPCASKYSSHPWFRELGCLSLFGSLLLQGYKVQALSRRSVHKEERYIRTPLLFFVHQRPPKCQQKGVLSCRASCLDLRCGPRFKTFHSAYFPDR